jgi:hypothetical protein
MEGTHADLLWSSTMADRRIRLRRRRRRIPSPIRKLTEVAYRHGLVAQLVRARA